MQNEKPDPSTLSKVSEGLELRVCKRWFPNGGSSWSGEQIPAPYSNLDFASVVPRFYLFYTSCLPHLNLCSAGNLEPRFGNHNLQPFG